MFLLIYLTFCVSYSYSNLIKNGCPKSSYVDLTWEFNENTIYFPNASTFSYTKALGNDDRGYWYSAKEFCAAEHGGTHLDAPYHFNKKGLTVGQIPLENLILPGVLLNMEDEVLEKGSSAVVLARHLNQIPIPNKKVILLIKFNWSQYWPNSNKYMGFKNGKMNFPGLSKEGAQWIVNNKNIVGVGVDTASIDPGQSSDFQAHRILTENDLYMMENVKLIEDLGNNFELFVMPMKIESGTGAPLRLIAKLNH